MKLVSTPADRKSVELLRQLDVFAIFSFNEALDLDELLHDRVFENGEIISKSGSRPRHLPCGQWQSPS